MERWGSSAKIGCVAVFLTGCSSMPPFDTPVDENNRPTVSTIIEKISCEIAEAKDTIALEPDPLLGYQPFKSWTAAATLTLTVDDTLGTATAGLPISFIDVVSKVETFAFGLSPTWYQNRSRTNAQTYSIDISKLPKYEICNERLKSANNFNLEGDLGLKNQILMNLHAFRGSPTGANYYAQGLLQGEQLYPTTPGTNNEPKAKTADTFSITAYFKVYYGVNNVAPTWTLTTFKGPLAGVGYVRDDLHQVVITFAPVPIPSNKVVGKPTPPGKEPGDVPDASRVKKAAQLVSSLSKTVKSEKVTEQDRFNYENAQRDYSNELEIYSNEVVSYAARARVYQAKVQRYSAELAAATQAAAAPNAADAARSANASAVTNAAINQLSQSLNRP